MNVGPYWAGEYKRAASIAFAASFNLADSPPSTARECDLRFKVIASDKPCISLMEKPASLEVKCKQLTFKSINCACAENAHANAHQIASAGMVVQRRHCDTKWAPIRVGKSEARRQQHSLQSPSAIGKQNHATRQVRHMLQAPTSQVHMLSKIGRVIRWKAQHCISDQHFAVEHSDGVACTFLVASHVRPYEEGFVNFAYIEIGTFQLTQHLVAQAEHGIEV